MSKQDIMKNWLQSEFKTDVPKDIISIIKDEADIVLDDIDSKRVALIIHRLSEMPWTTQEQIWKELDISKRLLMHYNETIYNSRFFQQLIIKEGLGRKYWNTMIPYIKNRVSEKVVNHEYQFPLRLALFPGLSCMYFCGFCGRNQKARYKGNVTKEVNQRFKDIISSMPIYSTMSISGGVEPLTNPG